MKPSKSRLFFTKLTHWEYWPLWAVYFPVIAYYFWLSLKARSFFFFSASNPSIETGGMMGESKYSILKNIPEEVKAFTLFFPAHTSLPSVITMLEAHRLSFPIILKPDVGDRGRGVEKINNEKELASYLATHKGDFLVQEYIDFDLELGVFYYRFPGHEKGTVSSIVRKKFLHVTGDGQSTLGELMVNDPRAGFQFERLQSKIEYAIVPPKGNVILLEPIGNHSRGTTFLDARALIDSQLTEVFDKISRRIPGFFFGRYDLRCSSIEALKEGRDIRILELNGAGSEPGHIYQPGYSIFKAWKELYFHWKALYEISVRNHKNGVAYMSLSEARKKYKAINKT